MKIAIMLGRGVEGCGVSKFAYELKSYFKDDCTIYVNDYKGWVRRKAIKFDYQLIEKYDPTAYDQCWILSLPAKNFARENIDMFKGLLERTQCPRVLYQLDHSSHSLTRNADLADFCNLSTTIGMHSFTGDFMKFLNKNEIIKPCFEIANPFSFDQHRAKYWKPIEQQERQCKFIGRSAVWKGIEQLFVLHNSTLKQHQFITTMEGMEASIGSLRFWFVDGDRGKGIRPEIEYNDLCVRRFNSIVTTKMETNRGPYVFGPYFNEECMHRLSKCIFSAHFTTLKPEKYGNIAEYTLLENIASGTIPVIGKHYMTHARAFITGENHRSNTYAGLPYNGDDSTSNETVDKLIAKLIDNPALRDAYREKCYQYWKSQYDASIVVPKLLQLISDCIGTVGVN